MKKLFFLISIMLASQNIYASGYICRTHKFQYNVMIYNHTDPSLPTEQPAVMIISDSKVSYGRRTIAVFQDQKSNLSKLKNAPVYYGTISQADLSSGELRAGEYILGTRLGYLRGIYFSINKAPHKNNPNEFSAVMIGIRKDGDNTPLHKSTDTATCRKYLKHPKN